MDVEHGTLNVEHRTGVPAAAGPHSELARTVYTPDSDLRRPRELLVGLWYGLFSRHSRGLAWRLLVRDLSAQYRSSFLSLLWVFVPPVVTSAIWIFLNGQQILRVAPTELPYPLFVFTGTLLWSAFTGALSAPRDAIARERGLLSRVSFPREALLLVSFGDQVINTLIQFVLLIPMLVVYRVHFGPLMLLGPVGVLAIMLIGYAIGLILAPAGLLMADIGRIVPIIARFGYFVTPIIYPIPKTGLAAGVAHLNPLTPLVATARDWLTGQPASMLGGFCVVTAVSLVVLFVGLIVFRVSMPIVIERASG